MYFFNVNVELHLYIYSFHILNAWCIEKIVQIKVSEQIQIAQNTKESHSLRCSFNKGIFSS
jgi:hypothetical protein